LENIHINVEECCEVNYGFSRDCVANSVAKSAAVMDTATATAATIIFPESFGIPTLGGNIASEKDDAVKKFIPVFDGGTTMCQNVGKPPSWMSWKDIKQTKAECCRAYAFQWDYATC